MLGEEALGGGALRGVRQVVSSMLFWLILFSQLLLLLPFGQSCFITTVELFDQSSSSKAFGWLKAFG